MNKMNGKMGDFAYLKEDGSRMVVSYGLKELENGLWEWYEVYLNKKQVNQVTLQVVKDSIIGDINARTDERILNGFPWTVLRGDHRGETVNVWLSNENQRNFSEAQRVASMTNGHNLPLQVKVAETEEKEPIYDTFETVQEITTFYLNGVGFIDECLKDGWTEKDGIDWGPYEEIFDEH
jgi:hypothetical protein